MANSPAAAAATSATGDSRRRLSASIEAICKRRFRRNSKGDGRLDMVKPFNIINFPTQDKNSSCCCSKSQIVKVLLFILLSATLFTIIYSPEAYHHSLSHSSSRWIWRRQDLRYVSDLEISWDDVTKTLESVEEGRTIGVLNFDSNEIRRWREVTKTKDNADEENVVELYLDYADKNVTWDALYPEWIDEEQEKEVPVCPDLPKIKVPTRRLDLIVVKLPCRKEGNWSRDVGRLHLQMAAATVAASAKGFFRGHVLFVSRCFPIPNLFQCKDLVSRRGDVWLYKPNLDTLRNKLQLPIGSCELSLPLGIKERPSLGNPKREAYATILHSAHVYVCGAIAAAQSIRQSGSTRDLVILVDDNISGYHRSGLEAAGWQIRTIQRIRNPKAEKDAYNEWNYSKFRLWQLTDYDKIIFIDADLLILRNIDFLFSMPEISATGNNGTLFNSGVMVIEPCNCTFQLLMEHINEIESYNGGDQGYLNEVFTWWHRIPKHMNFLKATKDFLDRNPEALTATLTTNGDRPIHKAVLSGHIKIVEEIIKRIHHPVQVLEIKNDNGYTALAYAATGGIVRIVECLVNKCPSLVSVRNANEHIPIVVASLYGHKDLVRYLYNHTPLSDLDPCDELDEHKGKNGAMLVTNCIVDGLYGIALDLIQRYPKLAYTRDSDNDTAIIALAQTPCAFPSGTHLAFWQRWVYSCEYLDGDQRYNPYSYY